ncbi:hypothetical protein B0H14DRAFT_2608207 [Mycena olivaceomarginata]|nr:hypothetical protein B0H14DRAFT_2608207 [Mycena olivaceomarginata]
MHFEFICLCLCMKLSPGLEDSVLTSLQLPVTEATQAEAQRVWQEQHQAEAAARAEFTAAREREAEAERRATSKIRVGHVLQAVKAAGYGSLYGLLDDLVTTKDQNHSSQVSQMLISHGDELLDSIRSRQPDVVSQWISKVAGNILAEEGAKLAQHLRPPHGQSVLATVLCILAQTTNEKASEYQTTMGIYLLACGASRSQFDVLNHAGICLSYRSVLRKIKALGEERLEEMRHIVKRHMFMIIWENLNFAFRVGQQRLGSDDHFDNGTTATGIYPSMYCRPRRSRLPVLEFSSQIDLLPTLEDVQNLEALQRYHIEEILLDAYPVLRTRFRDSISGPPSILSIPVHRTSQYPAPAMPIDESSLDGTIDVFSTIFRNTLKLTGQDIERHGVVAASRRDDVDLLDNLSRYGKEQLGIFHAKVAGTRMTVNEHWGTANSKALWSLWKINSMLGRKPMTAGWKAKKLPPFRPSYELIIDLALPANILDGFRLFCAKGTVEKWIESVKDWDSVRIVAAKGRSMNRELLNHIITKNSARRNGYRVRINLVQQIILAPIHEPVSDRVDQLGWHFFLPPPFQPEEFVKLDFFNFEESRLAIITTPFSGQWLVEGVLGKHQLNCSNFASVNSRLSATSRYSNYYLLNLSPVTVALINAIEDTSERAKRVQTCDNGMMSDGRTLLSLDPTTLCHEAARRPFPAIRKSFCPVSSLQVT